MLSVEGPDPFGRTMTLAEETGMVWNLDPGRFEHELSLLGGHQVRVFCSGLSDIGEGALTVDRYELLPVDGREPVYGVLQTGPGSIIVDSDGTSVHLDGPLAEALVGFDEHAVWVWGERGHRGRLVVEGYVVMGRVLSAPATSEPK
jgi:hypothetical protein